MTCLACDLQNRAGADRCARCAAPMPPTCIGCGAALPAGQVLCVGCRTERLPAALGAEELFTQAPGDRTAVTLSPYELRTRFVGRERALEVVKQAAERVLANNELHFVLVTGEPGAGKTRLLREATRAVRQQHPTARLLSASAGGTGALPYAGVARLLLERLGISATDGIGDAQDKIFTLVSELLPTQKLQEVAHLVAHLLRVGFTGSPIVEPLAEQPQQLEARTFIAVKRLLAADAERAPLLLCLDDLDRAGADTVRLVQYLVAGLASSPLLIVGAARPGLDDSHLGLSDGDTKSERIELGPFDEWEAENFFRELLRPIEHYPETLVDHARRVGRIPRTLIELVRLLVESEAIVRTTPTSWAIDDERLARMTLPEDTEALLAARLAFLPEPERDLLEKAAVIGDCFWLDAAVALVRVTSISSEEPDGPTLGQIAAAGDRTRQMIAQTLAGLVEREWIVAQPESVIPGEREYRFAYPMLWETIHAGLDTETRCRYHRRVAQWLELRPLGRHEEAQEEIARHLEQAGDAEGAAARYRRAADTARGRYLNDKAIRLYAQALACLSDADLAARIHLWHDLGSVYELKGDSEAALGAFERMLRLTWVVSSRAKAAVAFNKLGRVWRRKGDLRLALEYLERGAEMFAQAADTRGVAGSLDDVGNVLWLLGRYDEAHDHITRALEQRRKEGDLRSIAHSLSNLGNVNKDRGDFDDAEKCHAEALALRRTVGDRAGAISSLNNLAVLSFERGDQDGARRMWSEALADAEDIGALPLQALALANLGEVALVQKKTEEARRRLDETIAIVRDLDDRRLLADALRNLALLVLEEGDASTARAHATESLQIAQSSGLRDYEGRALVALGEVHAGTLFDADRADGDVPLAEDFFRRGVALFREVGNDSELAKGLDRFGRYHLEHGNTHAGRTLLEEAHRLYVRLGMKASDELQKVLGEL